jgi:hypothetical protein
MQASVTTGGFDSILASVRRQVERKWQQAGRIAEEAAEFGSKTAQSYTASRPGASTWIAGRIDTGSMVAAIRWKPVGSSMSSVRTRYGFVGDFKEYYRIQTVTGFRHVRSKDSQFIAPTFALRDSREPVRAFARAQLRSRL